MIFYLEERTISSFILLVVATTTSIENYISYFWKNEQIKLPRMSITTEKSSLESENNSYI
jgi:hypothetical protein